MSDLLCLCVVLETGREGCYTAAEVAHQLRILPPSPTLLGSLFSATFPEL